jgi:hypothetical protein
LTNFPFWAGDPCPLHDSAGVGVTTTTCAQGRYPAYAVAAKSPKDVSDGLKFAARHNLRVVVKNTGHDFLGRYELNT